MRRRDFETALKGHQRRVFSYALYVLSNREEAEDVLQEVFLKLWRNGSQVPEDRLEAWLLKVARNACIDRQRRRTSGRRVFSDSPLTEDRSAVAPRSADPEVLALATESGQRLGAAVAELREPGRSIVILREIQGLSYQNIADVLGIGLSSVKVSLHRARRHLREQLREVHDHAAAI